MNITHLIQNCPYWQDYTEHKFVRELGRGTLPLASFKHYLIQDYLFLLQFARAWGLAVYKAENVELMKYAQQGIQSILEVEQSMHLDFCESWGISAQEIQKHPESPNNIGYTRYVLDIGMKYGIAELFVAMAPCALGYSQIAEKLAKNHTPNNPYQKWIDMYDSDTSQESVQRFMRQADQLIQQSGIQDPEHWQRIFNTATRMEIGFWQMGLDLS